MMPALVSINVNRELFIEMLKGLDAIHHPGESIESHEGQELMDGLLSESVRSHDDYRQTVTGILGCLLGPLDRIESPASLNLNGPTWSVEDVLTREACGITAGVRKDAGLLEPFSYKDLSLASSTHSTVSHS